MKTINATTKRGQAFIYTYNTATARRLSDVYTNPSTAKTRAEIECLRAMIAEDGQGFKILSYNTFCFSCGWETAQGLRIETATNSYLIK